MFLGLVALALGAWCRGVMFRTRLSAGGTSCMTLNHGGVGVVLLPRILWLSSSATV